MDSRLGKLPYANIVSLPIGGEGGIRTREPLWVTRFPSVRAKPDYATSPFVLLFSTAGGIIPQVFGKHRSEKPGIFRFMMKAKKRPGIFFGSTPLKSGVGKKRTKETAFIPSLLVLPLKRAEFKGKLQIVEVRKETL